MVQVRQGQAKVRGNAGVQQRKEEEIDVRVEEDHLIKSHLGVFDISQTLCRGGFFQCLLSLWTNLWWCYFFSSLFLPLSYSLSFPLQHHPLPSQIARLLSLPRLCILQYIEEPA